MLGGGTFTSQNKVLPGAYINFISAARAAAAARAQKIALIQQRILIKNQELMKVNRQIASLSSEHGSLGAKLSDWCTQKAAYNGNEAVSEVVILNIFEGICADTLKEEVSSCVEEMDKTYSGMTSLNTQVNVQIGRLQERVSIIGQELRDLQLELSSL